MSSQLKDKICLVTGAGRGIGQAIALRFAQEGAVVYANYRTDDAITAWSGTLPEDVRTRILPIQFDLTDRSALKEAVLQIRKEHNRIDVLVNNAGIVYNEPIGMTSYEHVSKMFEVNVFAVIELIQMVSRIMTRQGGGSIINISSMVGVHGSKGQSAYSASKGAVIALTKSAAKELAPAQIRVNSIAPGMTATERAIKMYDKVYDESIARIGMKRLADPVDIANACVFLASDQSAYITGQILGVDGSAVF